MELQPRRWRLISTCKLYLSFRKKDMTEIIHCLNLLSDARFWVTTPTQPLAWALGGHQQDVLHRKIWKIDTFLTKVFWDLVNRQVIFSINNFRVAEFKPRVCTTVSQHQEWIKWPQGLTQVLELSYALCFMAWKCQHKCFITCIYITLQEKNSWKFYRYHLKSLTLSTFASKCQPLSSSNHFEIVLILSQIYLSVIYEKHI